MADNSNGRRLLIAEEMALVSGLDLASDSPDVQSLLLRMKNSDGKSADALAMEKTLDPLQAVRVHLYRGRLNEARRIIDEIRAQGCSPELQGELLLEESRHAMREGRFSDALGLASLAAKDERHHLVTRTTATQVRSLANYELGDFKTALQDIEQINALAKLMPAAQAVWYARVLKVRITARTSDYESARRQLNEIWSQALAPRLLAVSLLDTIHTLVRTEVDLRMNAGMPFASWALASYNLAKACGEPMYEAWGLAELTACEDASLADAAGKTLQLVNDWNYIKTVAASFLKTKDAVKNTSGSRRLLNTHLSVTPKAYYFSEAQAFFNVNAASIVSLGRTSKLAKAVDVLSCGPAPKQKIFEAVWGQNKYVPHLHDQGIRVLMGRIRKELNVRVGTGADGYETSDVLTVGGDDVS